MKPSDPGAIFAFFNEISIIQQLSSTRMDAALPDGLITPHFSVLNHLSRVQDGRTPLQIARAFQVPKTSMTNTLATLQRHELVDVKPNPKDARSKLVWITDKGRQVRGETIEKLIPAFATIFESYDLEKMLHTLPTLSEVREILDKARD